MTRRAATEPPPYDEETGRARAYAVLEALAQEHSSYPQCVVCGQRSNRLDVWQTCSREDAAHESRRRTR